MPYRHHAVARAYALIMLLLCTSDACVSTDYYDYVVLWERDCMAYPALAAAAIKLMPNAVPCTFLPTYQLRLL